MWASGPVLWALVAVVLCALLVDSASETLAAVYLVSVAALMGLKAAIGVIRWRAQQAILRNAAPEELRMIRKLKDGDLSP
jgi:hypothetical protein